MSNIRITVVARISLEFVLDCLHVKHLALYLRTIFRSIPYMWSPDFVTRAQYSASTYIVAGLTKWGLALDNLCTDSRNLIEQQLCLSLTVPLIHLLFVASA